MIACYDDQISSAYERSPGDISQNVFNLSDKTHEYGLWMSLRVNAGTRGRVLEDALRVALIRAVPAFERKVTRIS